MACSPNYNTWDWGWAVTLNMISIPVLASQCNDFKHKKKKDFDTLHCAKEALLKRNVKHSKGNLLRNYAGTPLLKKLSSWIINTAGLMLMKISLWECWTCGLSIFIFIVDNVDKKQWTKSIQMSSPGLLSQWCVSSVPEACAIPQKW